jgi:hypothetical protein
METVSNINEETLVVRHPATYTNVKIIDCTQWMPADDATPVKGSREMSVRCMIAEVVTYDDYDEPLSTVAAVKHQSYDAKKKKWHTDVAFSELLPDRLMTEHKQHVPGGIPGLKQRFGAAIAAYEAWLVKEGRDLPIVLIADEVYPQAINALICRGVRTVNALAVLTDTELATLRAALEAMKLPRMAGLVEKFRDKARAKLVRLGVTPAAEIGSGRPKKAA